jgi:alpha/beta superfamily hydrolase
MKSVRALTTTSLALDFFLGLQALAMSEIPIPPKSTLHVETPVCGSFREPFMFWLWHGMAGRSRPQAIAEIERVQQLEFRTRDGITLRGYKLAAENPKAYLLVAQGNAMLADQLVADLQTFRDLGWDVYVYDYRGYGTSQGKSRLAAIVDDYIEIVGHLNSLGYDKRLLYGISMGGVILLDAVGNTNLYSRLVIDSSPARISDLGCPERYDPVAHLPKDSARLLIISGDQDTVVPPAQMDELIGVARSRGARIVQDPELAHPYQDSSAAIHRRRQQEISAFLSQE